MLSKHPIIQTSQIYVCSTDDRNDVLELVARLLNQVDGNIGGIEHSKEVIMQVRHSFMKPSVANTQVLLLHGLQNNSV